MGKRDVLKEVPPEFVEQMLKQLGTQAAVARSLNVGQGSLSLYMRKHGFKKVEKWERSKEVQA